MGVLPDWFRYAPNKYRKLVRVLGATVHIIHVSTNPDEVDEIAAGYRLFSNINPHDQFLMKTAIDDKTILDPLVGKAGFIMLVNNYLSEKEFDITNENLHNIKFYIRPFKYYTLFLKDNDVLDFVAELELVLREY
jgi:hypothetical protein